MKQKPLNKRVHQHGFTLLEIVIAIAIVALLAAAILPGLLQNREDAKYSTALTQLQKDFPSAITRQVARTNNCAPANFTAAALQQRGLPVTTAWNENWTASAAGNLVTIVYPISNAQDPTSVGNDMKTALTSSNNVNSVSNSATAVTVVYRCN